VALAGSFDAADSGPGHASDSGIEHAGVGAPVAVAVENEIVELCLSSAHGTVESTTEETGIAELASFARETAESTIAALGSVAHGAAEDKVAPVPATE